MERKLSRVLDYLIYYIDCNGYAPSIREIGNELKIQSTSSVSLYLDKLVEQGYIKKDGTKSRAIEILQRDEDNHNHTSNKVSIPLIGKIKAGTPIEAIENIDDTFEFPKGLFKRGDLVMLKVEGDSMIEADIKDGDKAVIKLQNTASNGDIVAAKINGEATLKRFYKTHESFILRPENKYYSDIISPKVEIVGVMVGLIRSF